MLWSVSAMVSASPSRSAALNLVKSSLDSFVFPLSNPSTTPMTSLFGMDMSNAPSPTGTALR